MWEAAALDELAGSWAGQSNMGSTNASSNADSQVGSSGGVSDSSIDNSEAGGFFAWMGRAPTATHARGVHAGVDLGVRTMEGGEDGHNS